MSRNMVLYNTNEWKWLYVHDLMDSTQDMAPWENVKHPFVHPNDQGIGDYDYKFSKHQKLCIITGGTRYVKFNYKCLINSQEST